MLTCMNKNQCPRCFNNFCSTQRLKSHLERKIPCKEIPNNNPLLFKKMTVKCPEAQLLFKENCKDGHCSIADVVKQVVEKMKEETNLTSLPQIEQQVQILKNKVNQLTDKPLINNQNILQVVCVGQKDNYLDMLTQEYNDFDRALEFIKDCALSSLSGDCKLIEKIYLNQGPQLNLYFVDKNRTKIEYYNENKELVRDTKELFGRKLANNLQNSYLKGVNHLITDNLENKRCPNKFLEDYDLQMWNQHIFDLSDLHYQKKIINRLNIPLKTN